MRKIPTLAKSGNERKSEFNSFRTSKRLLHANLTLHGVEDLQWSEDDSHYLKAKCEVRINKELTEPNY